MADETDAPVPPDEAGQAGGAVTPEPAASVTPPTPVDDVMGKATTPGLHQEQGGMRS